jgi:hypothetical protein
MANQCKCCLDVVTPDNNFDLNEDDLCDTCCAKQQKAAIYNKAAVTSGDFDYSMNG